jgi:hypothetical protein
MISNWKLWVIAACLCVSFCVSALGRGRVPESFSRSANAVAPEVRDEPDPSESQSCFALGRLDITFRTENKGAPTVGLVVTDPRGRRIGFDPLLKDGWQELPQAQGFIDCDAPNGEGACQGLVQICGPVSGTYKLEVIAVQNADYTLDISGRSEEVRQQHNLHASRSGARLTDVAIEKGSRDILLLDYSRDPNSKIAFEPQHPVPVAGNE